MKKGQFYLLAAVILISLSFIILMLSKKTIFIAETDSFSELHTNYLSESSQTINNILYEKNNNNQTNFNFARFDSFTSDFLDYSKTLDAGFSLAYAITYHNTTKVKNYVGFDIVLNNNSLENNNELTITSDDFSLIMKNITYDFEVNKDVELNILFRSESNNNVRVFKYDG